MKPTDLEKLRGLKINNRLKQDSAPGRFGADAAPDRRAQRRRDAELGLVPFAVKLPTELAARLREQATARGTDLNGLVAELLAKGLAAD